MMWKTKKSIGRDTAAVVDWGEGGTAVKEIIETTNHIGM